MADAAGSVSIRARFNGPPGSANGGYACGVAAGALSDGPAEVRLRLAPPLESPLAVVATGDGIQLEAAGEVVATARPWTATIDAPDAPTPEVLSAAVAGFDADGYHRHHPFERCFSCGPAREPGDGLRLFPAPVSDTMVAWPWRPAPSTAGDDGLVDPRIMWAALDCPSGLSWLNAPDGSTRGPAVLGQLAARVDRRPAVGDDLVVGGWQVDVQGRKLFAGSAVWSADGEVLARGAATWILLDDVQVGTFGAKT